MLLVATALVYKNDSYFLKTQKEMEKVKTNDLCNYGVPLGYRCRNCDTQFNSQTPAAQYQRQKVIQGAVRVASSLYTMNIGSLTAYQKPTAVTQDVCWNQMSDRREPHVQRNVIATGSQYHGSSTRRTITRLRPGALSPGGKGVDIKHNSYERRLNRLKGRSVLRQGALPPNYGAPVPFNLAFPVYGGKTFKAGIVNGCGCKENDVVKPSVLPNDIYNVIYNYYVGENVFAPYVVLGKKNVSKKATIVTILQSNAVFLVKFENGVIQQKYACEIVPYVECKHPMEPENNVNKYFSPAVLCNNEYPYPHKCDESIEEDSLQEDYESTEEDEEDENDYYTDEE